MSEPQGQAARRISLTRSQLQTELGAELLSLCQTVTSDGRLTPEELADLRSWLTENSATDLPAIAHLREVLNRILADGQVTLEEYRELYRALETVLPPEARRVAKGARVAVEVHEKAQTHAERETQRARTKAERERNRPFESLNFMVAGCRYEGRPQIIREHVRPGDAVDLARDRANRYSQNAIAVRTTGGHQIGFVPEVDTVGWAPEIDGGAVPRGHITKVLTGGRSPIPVVQAYLYRADAAISEHTARSFASPRVTAAPTKGFPFRVALLIVVAILLVIVVMQN